MAYESQKIGILLSELSHALYPDEDDPTALSMENLQGVVYSVLSKSASPRLTKDDKERYMVLKIVCRLLLWLEHDIFAKPVSEHVFGSVWSQILNTMFGELASKSSKNCREMTEAEFGNTTQGVCGRK
ncbi:hypothetical protein BGZ83_002922, partial [Gryganskiella cystojenkinii]